MGYQVLLHLSEFKQYKSDKNLRNLQKDMY